MTSATLTPPTSKEPPLYMTHPELCSNSLIKAWSVMEPYHDLARATKIAADLLGRTSAYKGKNGELRWASNNRCVPEDIAEFAHYLGVLTEAGVWWTEHERDLEQAAFIAEYQRQRATWSPSGEELAEMRAAFGEGEVVVDVITGRRIQL